MIYKIRGGVLDKLKIPVLELVPVPKVDHKGINEPYNSPVK
jgi:hypothetical protein